jgi:hypothetical protein
MKDRKPVREPDAETGFKVFREVQAREDPTIEELITAANELALARAHLVFPIVLEVERRIPKWMVQLSSEAGFTEFERKHGVDLPDVLRRYYHSPRLICLLQAAWDVDVFLENMDRVDPPEIRMWNGRPHVVIGYFPHSDTVCGAELLGQQQYMYWEGYSENRQPQYTLSEWVYGAASRLLKER